VALEDIGQRVDIVLIVVDHQHRLASEQRIVARQLLEDAALRRGQVGLGAMEIQRGEPKQLIDRARRPRPAHAAAAGGASPDRARRG